MYIYICDFTNIDITAPLSFSQNEGGKREW